MDKDDRLMLLDMARLLTVLAKFVLSVDDAEGGHAARAEWDMIRLRIWAMEQRMKNY